jgi:hypothetical protein
MEHTKAASSGPGARDERQEGASSAAAARVEESPGDRSRPLQDDESRIAPDVADGIDVRFVDVGAPWLETVGGDPAGTRLVAGVAARVRLLFDDTKADLRHEVEWEAVIHPVADEIDVGDAAEVDYDDRDLRTDPSGVNHVFVLPEAKIHTKTLFSKAQTQLKDRLYREETLALYTNRELKLTSRIDESIEDFGFRCDREAEERADADVAKLRGTLEGKSDRVHAAMEKSEDRIRELQSDVSSRGRDQLLDIGMSVLGGVFGGRRSTRSILGGARRASSKERVKANAEERLVTAQNRLEERVDELDELENELTDSLFEIQADWDERAKTVEEIAVPLEKADISVHDFTLIWIPTA